MELKETIVNECLKVLHREDVKDEFKELAEDAKKNCPISGALNCDIILNPTLI